MQGINLESTQQLRVHALAAISAGWEVILSLLGGRDEPPERKCDAGRVIELLPTATLRTERSSQTSRSIAQDLGVDATGFFIEKTRD